jgi:hypothetical protein
MIRQHLFEDYLLSAICWSRVICDEGGALTQNVCVYFDWIVEDAGSIANHEDAKARR